MIKMNKPFWEYKQNKNGALDIPVGETFDYGEETLKVISANATYGCDDCFFNPHRLGKGKCALFACLGRERKDGQSVVFEEVKNDKKEG